MSDWNEHSNDLGDYCPWSGQPAATEDDDARCPAGCAASALVEPSTGGAAHAAPLPPWQAERLATLLDALDGIPVSDAERRTLAWVCGFEAHTVEHLAGLIERAQAVARSMQAARDALETGRLARQLGEARDDARSSHLAAHRYRGQLVDLCEWAGIDPGADPHGALIAHLRDRGPVT